VRSFRVFLVACIWKKFTFEQVIQNSIAMKTIIFLLSLFVFCLNSHAQKSEPKYIDGIRVFNSDNPGFVVGMDEYYNYVFLNTITGKRMVVFENSTDTEGLLDNDESLTLKVQNGYFYAVVEKFDPNLPMGNVNLTDEELSSKSIVKYSIEYLRLRTSN